jgi:hypothetical protein
MEMRQRQKECKKGNEGVEESREENTHASYFMGFTPVLNALNELKQNERPSI